jgi:uncharacterized membrane protein YccC
MGRLPRPRRRDYAAAASVAATLAVAYVVVPTPVVQYGAWLVVFCIWMVWFILFAVSLLPNIDT